MTGTKAHYCFERSLYPDARHPRSVVENGNVLKELPESMMIWVATAVCSA